MTSTTPDSAATNSADQGSAELGSVDQGRLSVGEKVGYGLGDTASNLYWKIFEFFLMYFYTDVFGITAKSAGTMMLVTRIWDAINDPFVGYIADRTKTAWGRFRPYLIWFCVPFAITGALTFYTPDLGPTGKLVYAYITYTLVMMIYTANQHSLWGVDGCDLTEFVGADQRFNLSVCISVLGWDHRPVFHARPGCHLWRHGNDGRRWR